MVTTFCGDGDEKQTTQDFKPYECHIFIITSLSLLLFHWVNSYLLVQQAISLRSKLLLSMTKNWTIQFQECQTTISS